jgi:hypothetical protein
VSFFLRQPVAIKTEETVIKLKNKNAFENMNFIIFDLFYFERKNLIKVPS